MVTVATLGASALLALTGGAVDQASRLHAVDPATLRPVGPSLRLPSWAFGLAWARSGPLAAVVVKPGGTGNPIRIVDTRRMRVVATIGVGAGDVAGLTFRGRTLVALAAADQPAYGRNGRFSIVRVDVARGRITGVKAVRGLQSVFPTNLAFGDGFAFVARAGGGVDAVDLRTGTVTRHVPKRSLAKGEGIVPTRWLGRHELGVGARVVDVRTWRSRLLEPGARGIAPAGDDVAVFGPRGVGIYTRGGRLRFRALAGVAVDSVHVRGQYLYAAEPGTADVVDLRTHREVRAAADPDVVWGMLAA
jgi:hypothetical protein